MHGSSLRSWCAARGRCDDLLIDRRSLPLAVLAASAAALVVVGVNQARERPDFAPGGGGVAAFAVQLGAGLALAVAGVHVARRCEFALSAALLVAAAGLGLHALPEPAGGAALFTLALVGAGVPAVAAGHAALMHPGSRAATTLDRWAVVGAYAVTLGLAGLVPALVFDPRRSGCFDCPHNLVLVQADPGAANWLGRWAPSAAAAAGVALAVLIVVRLLRRPAIARTIAAPVSVAAVAALGLSAAEDLRVARGIAGPGTDRVLWLSTSVALGLVAVGLAWRPVRAILVRGALGRLAVAATANAHDVRDVLGRALGDPGVRLLWPHPETRQPTQANGAAAAGVAAPGRVRTAVERSGRVVAWIEHRADLRAAPDLLATAVRTAGLTLEREALRTAQRRQAHELRESTLRLVSAGDHERRRLERDLHDGAQQRLLALGLRLARERAAAPPDVAQRVAMVEARVAAAREALRQIAHGIHSVTLTEGGLAEAVLALVQAAPDGVKVQALPGQHAGAEAEAAVYRLVAASLQHGAGAGVHIAIQTRGGQLTAAIHVAGADAGALTDALAHAGARITALGGSLTVVPVDGGVTANASVPAAV
jgi:signal transduction histidine kinase